MCSTSSMTAASSCSPTATPARAPIRAAAPPSPSGRSPARRRCVWGPRCRMCSYNSSRRVEQESSRTISSSFPSRPTWEPWSSCGPSEAKGWEIVICSDLLTEVQGQTIAILRRDVVGLIVPAYSPVLLFLAHNGTILCMQLMQPRGVLLSAGHQGVVNTVGTYPACDKLRRLPWLPYGAL